MTPSPPLPARAIDALRRGDTIEATKLLRASTGLSLKDAKDVVDAYRRGDLLLPPRSPETGTSRAAVDAHGVGGRSPGEVPRSGPPLRWLAIVALVAYVLYSFFGRR